MEIFNKIAKTIEEGDDERILALINEALSRKTSASDILNQGMLAGMKVVGVQFKNHDIFLPDVLLAAKAMHAGVELIKPELLKAGKTFGSRKVVLGTVGGDVHDIGKNLVGIMLQGAGFSIVDLGKDVPLEKFIEAVERESPMVLGMSAMLTTTMPEMKKVIDRLKEKGLTKKTRIIVGGAPVSKDYSREIRADGYARDASQAVERISQLVGAGS
ncbi:MAG: corrinoid protein [Elusimicrobiota bacterium]